MSDMSESSDDSLCYVDCIEEKMKQLRQEQFNTGHDMTVADGALSEAAFWCTQHFVQDNWDELDHKPSSTWQEYDTLARISPVVRGCSSKMLL